MIDRLFNEKESAQYLGISEAKLKDLVARKKLTAYKIGGQFLRFAQKDLDYVKASGLNMKSARARKKYSVFSRVKDYIYYNDFYIIAAILIIILLALVFKASF